VPKSPARISAKQVHLAANGNAYVLKIAKKIFGTENDRKLKKLRPLVDKINGLEPDFVSLSDGELMKAL